MIALRGGILYSPGNMYTLYSLLLFLSLFLYVPLYYIRLRLIRGERLHLKERFGLCLPPKKTSEKLLWIHAVSVGEVHAVQSLIQRLKSSHPDWTICFSALTNTGLRVAREKLTSADAIFFVPFDFKTTVRRFFKALRPDVFVLAESEFWPNLLRVAGAEAGRVVLVNGRISPRSQRQYQRFRVLMRLVLRNIDFFLVQTEREKSVLQSIGVDYSSIEVAGNLKTEIDLPEMAAEDVSRLKDTLGVPPQTRVILAGSTREGEEAVLLESFAQARQSQSGLVMILAPRHPDRAEEVGRICRQYSLLCRRRSALRPAMTWDVLILDTLGELAKLYSVCDIAFVGGSLVPWGGQNLLEPAFYEKPIFFGPHMQNFAFLAETFVRAGAAQVIRDKEDLVEAFLRRDEERLRLMGCKAKETLTSLQGATARTQEVIETCMAGPKRPSPC